VVNKERHEDALRVLSKLHVDKNDPDRTFAFQEYRQIKEQHEEDEKNKITWAQMWTVKSYRRRSFLGFFVMFGSQMTAILIAASTIPRRPILSFVSEN
jgi:hypothetical protein